MLIVFLIEPESKIDSKDNWILNQQTVGGFKKENDVLLEYQIVIRGSSLNPQGFIAFWVHDPSFY